MDLAIILIKKRLNTGDVCRQRDPIEASLMVSPQKL